ncbi:UNVERIFIED_CONTAM: Disease resistance protein RPP13 [Sesamum radiatum]|uniref:Disease resistance protein RPP13 n=1 Tax=Sesamum radiatum TaxID=300843 RepID=A0AAW2WGS3_SESRA
MAVAAYASLLSLMHVLDNVQHPARRRRLHLDRDQIERLQKKVKFLKDFLEVHSQRKSNQEIEDLVRQIAVVSYEAEHIIDLHVVDQLREGSQDEGHRMAAISSFCLDIDKIIEEIDSITEELMMIQEGWNNIDVQKPIVLAPATSSKIPSSEKNSTMVGFDEHLIRIMDELAGDKYDLQILPVVGMGGIGKTTLAKNIFDHPYIVNCFDIRIWSTISQEYNVLEILRGLLGLPNDVKGQESSDVRKLGEMLHKRLFGRKYLIVMDDMWSTEPWDEIKLFFPNNGNGSRIMITTRLSTVAASLGSRKPYMLDFLDQEKSWNLLCEKVFGQKSCPYPELEAIGKDIAKYCRGLPLAIVVIGGLLANPNMTGQNHWESVAKNVKSFANAEDNEHCLKILCLSYNHLPVHLKLCFLYMRFFREDDKIQVSQLTKLWVGEGFVKPIKGKTLEEAAKQYLKDLVDRNLILILEWTRRREFKICGIHDLLRDLCLRESDKEQFICVPKVQRIRSSTGQINLCFLCSDPVLSKREIIYVQKIPIIGSPSTSTVTALMCKICQSDHPHFTRLRWLKIFHQYQEYYLQHTKLHYIDMRTSFFRDNFSYDKLGFVFPYSISFLWNLQTLFINVDVNKGLMVVPSKIWEMPQLRHIFINSAVLPFPTDLLDSTILENLQTLALIYNFRCMTKVLQRIPNVKKLKLSYPRDHVEEWSHYCLYNLARLHKLESLFLSAENFFLENIVFPTALKKLTLSRCGIPWKDMEIIGSLLNLEVLKLYRNAFKGAEWNLVDGQFPRLRVLLIHQSDLVRWNAENNHFPNLERLFLEDMHDLEEIPSDIGDIATLCSIHLDFAVTQLSIQQSKYLRNNLAMGMSFKFGLMGKMSSWWILS